MKFADNLPIYIQIMNFIKVKIVSGEWNGGDQLPSVREFSKQLKVNPNTIQRVYQELEREGLIFTQRGTGTFVREDEAMIRQLKQSRAEELMDHFFREMQNIGFQKQEIKRMVMEWVEKEETE